VCLWLMLQSHRRGLALARDRSVSAFGALPAATGSHPRLTTVRVRLQAMVTAALRSLLTDAGPPDRVLSRTTLIRRESVTSPPTARTRPDRSWGALMTSKDRDHLLAATPARSRRRCCCLLPGTPERPTATAPP